MYNRIDLTYSRSLHPNGPWRKKIFKRLGEQKLFLESNGEGWHLDHWGGLVSQQYSPRIYYFSWFARQLFIHSLWDKAASNVD
jgi:hypothetical protein